MPVDKSFSFYALLMLDLMGGQDMRVRVCLCVWV